ncbi:class II fructose-bisphosphatase [soil metagenome]
MNEPIDRNLALELARVTEAAALMSARWMGRGDKEAADQAAVDAMRYVLGTVSMDGVVVIGEGAKDEAPMLFVGERVGIGLEPKVDIAVDPVEGTSLVAMGMPNAISVVALADRGSMFASDDIAYMEKIATGVDAADAIDLTVSATTNLQNVARAKQMAVQDLTVVVLERPRHNELVLEIREAGARIKFIPDGDVAGAMMTAMPSTGIDVLMGIGGAPEAVVAAAAMKCTGGALQARLWLRNEAERDIAVAKSIDVTKVFEIPDLVGGDNIFFSATGITDGDLLQGVRFFSNGASSQSLVMRSRTGTTRRIDAVHRLDKLDAIAGLRYR